MDVRHLLKLAVLAITFYEVASLPRFDASPHTHQENFVPETTCASSLTITATGAFRTISGIAMRNAPTFADFLAVGRSNFQSPI
jgi:hypothetical protein